MLLPSGVSAVISPLVLPHAICEFHSHSAITIIVSSITQDGMAIRKHVNSSGCLRDLVQLLTAHNCCLESVFPGPHLENSSNNLYHCNGSLKLLLVGHIAKMFSTSRADPILLRT